MSIIKKHKGTVLVLLASVLLCSTLGFQSALLLLTFLLTFGILNNKLSSHQFSSVLYRLIISFALYMAVLEAVILFTWSLNHNFPLDHILEVTGLVLVITYGWEALFSKGSKWFSIADIKPFARADIMPLAIGALILLLAIVGPVEKSLKNYGYISIQAIAGDYINTDSDDASHLSLINNGVQLNRGVLYKSSQAKYATKALAVSSYPPGWASANDVLIRSLDPSIKVGGQSLVAYIITKFLWLFVLVFCFGRTISDLYRITNKSRSKRRLGTVPNYALLTGSVGFFAFYLLLELYKQGFYTFLPLLTALLIIVPILIQLSIDKDGPEPDKFRTVLPIILIIAGVTLSWFLVMPAVIIAALVAVLCSDSNSKTTLWDRLLGVWYGILKNLPLIIVVIVSILAQILIITAPSSRTIKAGFDAPGGIALQSNSYFAFIFLGITLLYIHTHRQISRLLDNVFLLLVSLLGLSLFIYLYQIFTIQAPQYYYYKTLDSAMVIALPMAIVGWLNVTNYIRKNTSDLMSILIVLAMLMSLPLIIGIQTTNTPPLLINYILGRRSITLNEDSFIYKNISARAQVPIGKRKASVVFDVPGDVPDNIAASNILSSIGPDNACDEAIFNSFWTDNQSGAFMAIKKCPAEPIYIITRSYDIRTIKSLADRYGVNNKITILAVD